RPVPVAVRLGLVGQPGQRRALWGPWQPGVLRVVDVPGQLRELPVEGELVGRGGVGVCAPGGVVVGQCPITPDRRWRVRHRQARYRAPVHDVIREDGVGGGGRTSGRDRCREDRLTDGEPYLLERLEREVREHLDALERQVAAAARTRDLGTGRQLIGRILDEEQ